MKKFHFFILFTLIFIFFSFNFSFAQTNHKSWTVMVYMNGPEIINDEVYNFLNDLELSGGNENYNLLLFTNTQIGSHNENGIFLVNEDEDKVLHLEYLDGNGQDIASGSTLTYFLNYSRDNFPADHYALIFKRFYADFTGSNGDFFSDIVVNPHQNSKLGISGENNISSVLSDFAQSVGGKIDLFLMDVPYEMNLENIIAFKDSVNYLAGFELGNLDGNLYYKSFLTPFNHGDPDALTSAIKRLIGSSKKSGINQIAVVDLNNTDGLIDAFNKFVFSLISMEFDNKGNGDIARQWRSEINPLGYEQGLSLVDFKTFVNNVNVKSNLLQDSVGKINNIFSGMVVTNYSKAKGGLEGFSLYFPPTVDSYIEDYDNTPIAKLTYWDSYLKGQRVVNEGDPFDMTSHDGLDFIPGDGFEINLNGIVISVNPDEDYFQVDGTLKLSGVGEVTVSNLRLKLSSFIMNNEIVIVNYPQLTFNTSSFNFAGIQVFNPQITWDSSGIHIDGDLKISDVPIAGSELTLHAEANFTFQNGHLTFEDLSASNINGIFGDISITGNGTFETNPYKLTFSGKAVLDSYGELNFDNLVVGFDGTVFSYGTVSYSGGGFNLGNANINNLVVQWDKDGIYLQGTMSLENVTLMGAPLTFTSDITAMLSFNGSNLELSALDISSAHGEAGNIVFDGSASFYKNPDRIKLDGNLTAGSYGTLQVSDLEVGLDGSIVNFGSIVYNNSSFTIDNVTLSNVSIELKKDYLSVSGNFSINNIPFGGTTLSISGGAIAEIGFSGNGATLNDFLLNNVNVTGGNVSLTGNISMLHNPDRLQIEGDLTTSYGVFHFTDLEVGFDGHVYSYGTTVFNGNNFTYENLTILNPTVVLTGNNLTLEGDFNINNVELMGETFNFSGHTTLVMALNGSDVNVESFDISKINGASQNTTITGDVFYSSNPPSISIDGTITNSVYGTLNVSGLVIGLDGHVINYGTITYNANTFTVDGVTFKNAQITIDGNGLTVSGDVEIDNIQIAGHTFTLTSSATAVVSGGHLESLSISDFNMTDGDFSFSGSCSYDGSSHTITLNGNMVLGQYGTVNVENMIIGVDGHVESYGTITYSGSNININGAVINNVNIVVDDFHIGISGNLTIPDVMIAGSPVTINTDASVSFVIGNGLQLSEFDVNNFSVTGNGYTLSGSAHLVHKPDRLSISGTFDTTQYGTFNLSGFEVGFDGHVYSYGTLTYQNPQIVIDNVTLNNVSAILSESEIGINGNIVISNVPIAGHVMNFTADVSVVLKNSGSGFTVDTFEITKVSGGDGDFTINGSGVLLHNPDRIKIDGNAHLSQYGDITVSDLEIGLDGHVVTYGEITYNAPTFVIDNFTFTNVQLTWNDSGLNVSGNLRVDNIQIAGHSFTLTTAASAFINGNGLQSLNISDFNMTDGDFSFSGSCSYDGSSHTITLNGNMVLGQYGTVNVENMIIGVDGHVESYGTITYSGSNINVNGAVINNVNIVVDDFHIGISGNLTIPDVMIAGSPVTINTDASVSFVIGNGLQLSEFDVNNFSVTGNGYTLSGSAHLVHNPDRLSISGTFDTAQYGTFNLSGFEVGFDGHVYSYGTLTYQNPQIVIDNVTINNLVVSLSATSIGLSGNININNVPISGQALNFTANVDVELVNSGNGFTVQTFSITKVMATYGDFSIMGGGELLHNPDRIKIDGTAHLSQYGDVSFTDLEIGLDGTVYNYGTITYSLSSLTVGNVTFKNVTVSWSSTSLYIEGNILIPNVQLAGGNMDLMLGGNATFSLGNGGFQLQSLNLSNVHVAYNDFVLDGSATYLQNPDRVKIDGSVVFGNYGAMSVSDLEVGFDGHVYNYGTITYTNSYIQIGNATLTNLMVSWNGTALTIGGTISVNGIQLGGGVLGFSATAQAMFTTSNGVHLAQMQVTGISASYNDFSISGNALYLSNPDRIVISGEAVLGQYGNVTVDGLTVGLDGMVYNYGTITYTAGHIQVGDIYLDNVMASWDGTKVMLSGTIGLNSNEVSLAGSGVLTLVNTPSGMQLEDFQLTGISGEIQGFSFSGSAQYDSSIPGFHISGGIQIDGLGNVSVSDMVVDMNGHIVSINGMSGGITIGAYSFSGDVSFPAPGEVYIEGYVSLPQFISGNAGGYVHLRRDPNGGVMNSGWDILEGGMSIPSFEIGDYTFGGGNFGFDQNHVFGEASLQVPSMVGIRFSFDFGWDGTFNSACLAATGMRIPLASTGLFLNEAGGCLYHYHSPQDYWEVELDGVISDVSGMFDIDAMLSVNTLGELHGVGTVEVGNFPFSTAQIDISIPNGEIDAAAWLGEDPDEGLHVTGISVTGNIEIAMNWHDDWVYGRGGLHIHIISIINAGADGGFVYNYPNMPFSFGDASCEKLYHNGLGAAGEVHFLWIDKVYGVRIEDNNGLDFDTFSCDAD